MRLLIVLEIEGGWQSTEDLIDHWLLCPYKAEGHVKRQLTRLKSQGLLESRRGPGRGPWDWRLVDEGLGIKKKTLP